MTINAYAVWIVLMNKLLLLFQIQVATSQRLELERSPVQMNHEINE